jgi:ribonuclease Y
METTTIGILVGVSVVSGIIGYFVSKKINNTKFNIYISQAKAKAKLIELEAENLLKESRLKAKREFDEEFHGIKTKLEDKEREINKHLEVELEKIKDEKQQIAKDKKEIEVIKQGLKAREKDYQEKLNKVTKVLENVSGLTINEAKELMLQMVKDNSRAEVASIFRKEYKLAEQNFKKEVYQVLANTVTKYAGEFAAERLVNNILLPDEETKGKIIGKDGRNIKTLEMTLGVDIVIGEGNQITVSSFNLYRRAIATKTIQELIEDGRIQPARIEEVYKKVKSEFDANIIKEGQDVIIELGIGEVHPELVELVGRLRYRASYGQNALAHTLEVAYLAGLIASQLGGDVILARRAGLFHDIGKALTHEVKGSHVDIGADICKKCNEPDVVINAIYAHHGHEEPTSVESAAVCAADALSAARPGARREVLEAFLKRVEEIEAIATSHIGVINAYAINAGREVRVIVNAELVNDDEAIYLAQQIANDIEDKVQYPGEIKVNVIRELRAIEYAR